MQTETTFSILHKHIDTSRVQTDPFSMEKIGGTKRTCPFEHTDGTILVRSGLTLHWPTLLHTESDAKCIEHYCTVLETTGCRRQKREKEHPNPSRPNAPNQRWPYPDSRLENTPTNPRWANTPTNRRWARTPNPSIQKNPNGPIRAEVTKYADSEVSNYPQSPDKQRKANKSRKNRGFTSSRHIPLSGR